MTRDGRYGLLRLLRRRSLDLFGRHLSREGGRQRRRVAGREALAGLRKCIRPIRRVARSVTRRRKAQLVPDEVGRIALSSTVCFFARTGPGVVKACVSFLSVAVSLVPAFGAGGVGV